MLDDGERTQAAAETMIDTCRKVVADDAAFLHHVMMVQCDEALVPRSFMGRCTMMTCIVSSLKICLMVCILLVQ